MGSAVPFRAAELKVGRRKGNPMERGICSWRLVTALAVLALAWAPAASATDGTILITQATASHGLPGCPVTGFPIVICQPGSYRLGSNLSAPVDTGAIVVTATTVTLDLNGFAIRGSLSAIGVEADGANVSIKNGTITGFSADIYGKSGTTVSGVELSQANWGILATGSVMVTDSRLVGDVYGLYLNSASSVLAMRNLFDGDSSGIYAGQAPGVAYGENRFSDFTVDVSGGATHSMGNNVCSDGSVC